ncbi:hypothetical protein DENSPDRAFT_837202 [Dentipellis sp. KUC8613]|nr:hypothetical protein DENSPDRAFT_837202 [Dentipellis sp. KUC8613]
MASRSTSPVRVRSRSPSSPPPRPPSPPTQTFHPPTLSLPTPGLLGSVASGAHYSGVDPIKERRLSLRRSRPQSLSPDPHHPHRHSSVGAVTLPQHEEVLQDLKEMYELRATAELMERRWRRDATFEDPIAKCKGLDEIAPQWFSLSRLYTQSTTLSRRVLTSMDSPNRLIYWQKQEYVTRLTGSTKVVESIVVVDLDEENKIIKLVDQWQGQEATRSWGAEFLRRLNGKVVHWLPWLGRVPKEH